MHDPLGFETQRMSETCARAPGFAGAAGFEARGVTPAPPLPA
jgi:hypothetical protein